MEDILLTVGNNAQDILPVPYPRNPTPVTTFPVSYGDAPYPMAIKSIPRTKDDLQYCNFLEPSPRDQRLNVPYEGQKDCPVFKDQPYKKDSCYLMDNKAQGVVGIVCNQPGGSDNANFVRGNQFGVDYPYDFNKREMEKRREYTVEYPSTVQQPMQLSNPTVVQDENTFYPEMNFFLRNNKDYLTYPTEQNYTEYGFPMYNFPYQTLNPIFEDKNYSTPFNNNETFVNSSPIHTDKNNKHKIFVMLVIIFFIFFIIFFSS